MYIHAGDGIRAGKGSGWAARFAFSYSSRAAEVVPAASKKIRLADLAREDLHIRQ